MADKNPIGLAELINQVKQELLNVDAESQEMSALFSVDQVELELQVTVKKEAKASLAIYVVELGGGAGRDDVQKIKVTLTPLLGKKERIAYYKKQNPERWAALQAEVTKATIKGPDDGEVLDDLYKA